jgi:xylulokinase
VEALLGIDVGTTNIKAVAYGPQGQPLSQAACATPTHILAARQAQHDPEELWRAVASVIRQTTLALPQATHIAGLAVASIGEAGIPLDDKGQPLYPIIAWYDERSAPQRDWWARTLGAEAIYRITGLPLGHTFTLNKLLWLRENEPEVFARLRRWLCVADYVAFRLTGQQRMGYSLASRTMALDIARRQWSDELLSATGVTRDLFPALVAEGSLVGRVSAACARESGLLAGTPVYVGGHDHVCGALAMGVHRPGVVLDSTGTTEAELMALPVAQPYLDKADPSFCLGCHVAREQYYAIGSVLGAGSMVRWLAELLWPSDEAAGRESALERLTRAAAESPRGANGLYLLPYLAGAGSPNRDSTARGVLVGLSLAHTRADISRATLEGLAIELRVLWQALEGFAQHAIERVIVIGGGARNSLWNRIKADVTGRALTIPQHVEAVTLGAAVLAGIGCGMYRDEDDALRQLHLPCSTVQPDEEGLRTYGELYTGIDQRLRPLAVELGHRCAILR